MRIKRQILVLSKDKTIINGALFSLFSFINRGFSFFLLLILANYMPPEEYGYLGLFQTVIMVMGICVSLQLEGYMSVSYFDGAVDGFKNTVSCIFATTFIISIIYLLTILIGGQSFSELLSLPFTMLFLTVPICFFTVFTNINLDYFRIKGHVATYGAFSCGNAILNFVLSILLVKYLSMGWEGRVWAQTICFSLFGVIGILFFMKKKLFKFPNLIHWKCMLIWGVPLIPHMASSFFKQGCDRYIINSTHSIYDVGLFSFALNLANIIIMIGVGFNQSNSIEIYRVLGDKNISVKEKISILSLQRHKLIKLYAGISLLVVAAMYIIIPLILPKYSLAMNYFLILGIFGFINSLYYLYTNYLFFFKRTKNIMYITFSTSILHLVLSLMLTKYSLYLTCVIYCISITVMLFFIRYYSLKELKTRLVINF